jgi:hypothetical protein
MTLGMLVVDEQRYPISWINLAEGHIQFWIQLSAPVNLPRTSEIRVHASDGTMILCGPWALGDSATVFNRLRPGDSVSVCFPVKVAQVEGWPPVRTPSGREITR